MAANAGTVNVNLRLASAGFSKGMNTAKAQVSSFSGMLLNVKTLVGGFLAFKGIGFIKETMQAVDATNKFADSLGISTEKLEGLRHASQLTGASVEGIDTSLQKMTKNISDAANENVKLERTFKSIGLSAKELRTQKPDEQFYAIADALVGVNNASDRARISQELFGRQGQQLLPLLMSGSKGLREMQQEAESLGIAFNRVDGAKVEAANDAMTRVAALIRGVLTSAVIKLAPYIEAIATQLLNSARSAGGFGKITTGVFDTIKTGIGQVAQTWAALSMGIDAVKVVIYSVAAAYLKMGEIGATVIVGAMNGYESLGNLARGVFDNIVAANNVASAWIQQGFSSAIQTIGLKFAELLHSMAQGMRDIMPATSNQLTEAANAVTVASNQMAIDARKGMAAAEKDLVASKERIAEAWSNLTDDTAEHPLVKWFRESGESLQNSAQNSAVDFMASFSDVLNEESKTAIADWFFEVDALAQQNAEAAAARVEARLELDRNANEQQVANAQQTQSWLTDIWNSGEKSREEFSKKTALQKTQFLGDQLTTMGALMNSHSKRAFQIGKAAAMAGAVINTAAGAASALNDVPFPYNIAAMAAVIAAGAVQISTIASTQFGGGGAVSSAGGSIALVNGEPSGVSASQQVGVTGNKQNVLQVSVTGLSDDAILSGRQVRQLFEQMNEAVGDGERFNTVVT